MTLFRLGFYVLSSGLIAAAFACGGGNDGGGAKNPSDQTSAGSAGSSGGGSGAGASGSGDTAAASSGASPSSSGGGTTTTQLGDGGDLQGAKLGDKMHSETETKSAGPKGTHRQSANEPGRRREDLQAIIGTRRDDARACYDRALPDHPGMKGDLVINWVIDPDGNVTDPAVDTTKSSILEPSVGACVIEVIKKIKFAASPGGYETRANFPFNFKPGGGGKRDGGR
jgi:hypothetical protein